MPIAHHTGIILEWNNDNFFDSIITHYGVYSEGAVRVETMGDAIENSKVERVFINPRLKAQFQYPAYEYDDEHVYPGIELQEYAETHPQYDIWHCNCQHFVRHFVGDIPVESDIHPELIITLRRIFHEYTTGGTTMPYLQHLIDRYLCYQSSICNWDPTLTVIIR